MKLVRLGPAYSTEYTPDMLIEGYNSLVWTERYRDFSEFEIKSFDVDRMLTLLPENTLVSHLGTRHVMMVETASIEDVGEGIDARPEITIRGRSAAAILESRWVNANYQKSRTFRRKYTATGAAAVLLWQAVVNDTGFDVTRGDASVYLGDDPDDVEDRERNNYSWTTKDVIPNVIVTESVADEGDQKWRKLQQGILYPQLVRIMDRSKLGLRVLRPHPDWTSSENTATVIFVDDAPINRGAITRITRADIESLRFDLYKGMDRSEEVKLSLLRNHLIKPRYLFSSATVRTVAKIKSGEILFGDVFREGDEDLTGWQRKAMELDAGSPELPDKPERPDDLPKNATQAEKDAHEQAMTRYRRRLARWRNKRDNIIEDFREEAEEDALKALDQNKRTEIFSADISELSPYKYRTHFNLGDTVSLAGGYGLNSKVVVTEYTETENENGEQGFPSFALP